MVWFTVNSFEGNHLRENRNFNQAWMLQISKILADIFLLDHLLQKTVRPRKRKKAVSEISLQDAVILSQPAFNTQH